jgi:heterodisulfide reductase subunit A
MAAARALAGLGHEVEVLEREPAFGGKLLGYCCKATESCSRCGVCVGHATLAEALRTPGVRLTLGASVESVSNTGKKAALKIKRKNPSIDYEACIACDLCVSACPEGCITRYSRGEVVQYIVDYEKCRLHRGEKCSLCVDACPAGAVRADEEVSLLTLTGDAVLLATGHRAYDPAGKPRYGYGSVPGVITGEEAEALLSRSLTLKAPDGAPARDIAFIQCVGSRDPVIGNNYCSAVCCSYALRLARIIKHRDPSAAVTVYYIDIQNFDKNFSPLKKEILDLGVKLVRGVPFRIDGLAGGRLRLMTEDSDGSKGLAEHDLAVLSVGICPDPAAKETGDLFSVPRNAFGFFEAGPGEVPKNVFVTGTCGAPMSIPDSMTAARAVALRMAGAEG